MAEVGKCNEKAPVIGENNLKRFDAQIVSLDRANYALASNCLDVLSLKSLHFYILIADRKPSGYRLRGILRSVAGYMLRSFLSLRGIPACGSLIS